MKRIRPVLLPLALLLLPCVGASAYQPGRFHLVLGNPSNATPDPRNANNYLLIKPQYILSYNNGLGIPNWVCWHLQASDIGDIDRGDFYPDPSLPSRYNHVTPRHYTNTGFDRGHICPSKDRTDTEENNAATFAMTNIVPQAPELNQGPWKQLEDECRHMAQQGNELFIIAGPMGSAGTIANGRVNVPTHCWKVIAVVPARTRINAQTRVIAVIMPNTNRIRNEPWRRFRTTVRQIEQRTGFNIFSNMPPALQNVLETRVDNQ